MSELGHVVFYVRDLGKSVTFYTTVVGLAQVGVIFGGRAAVLTGGRSHHELLLIETGDAPGPLRGRRVGLYHVGWKLGDSLDVLRAAYERTVTAGYTVDAMSDHTVSQSIYLRDPDGNEVELFVDDPSIDWRIDRRWIDAPVKPLTL